MEEGSDPAAKLTASAVSSPSQVGRSTLQKAPLSYRWVISDAEIFLKNSKNGFRSPTFSVCLPDQTNSNWQLLCENYNDYKAFSLYLVSIPDDNDRPTGAKKSPFTDLLISNCTLSILNSTAIEVKHAVTVGDQLYKLNSNLKFGKSQFIKNLSDYLESGTLTIQVDAMLNCFSNPTQSLDTACAVPPDNIREDISHLYQNNDALADVTFTCSGKEFKAHKVILASQSPVFEKMFTIDMKEKRSETVEISDLTPEVLSDFLNYIYTGSCPNIKSLAKELLNVANKYELPRLMAMCERELEFILEPDNVFEYYALAVMHQANHLKASCMWIIKQHPEAVFQSQGWKSYTETTNWPQLSGPCD